MGTTLIINTGSSSKKFALYKTGGLQMTWQFERTGQGFIVCTVANRTKSLCVDINASEFKNALPRVLSEASEKALLDKPESIVTVGIRIVAPGTYFTEHRKINDEYIEKLTALIPFASHHIPNMLVEIEGVKKQLPKAELVGISDSAFHITNDAIQKQFSLPREDAEKFDLYRFGYHGLSASSVIKHLKVKEGSLPDKIVVCHVGSGVSVTAVEGGKSVATSMGYTPVSGIMMSSRMGDLPADVLATLAYQKGLRKEKLFDYLYNEGGFKGLCGVKDLRLVLDRANKGESFAKEALQIFARQVRNYIASYAMLMGGLDLIVLTATAVERNPVVRSLLVGELPLFHTYIHNDRNEALINSEGYLQTDDSKVKILVLKTDEMGEMYRVLQNF